MVWWFFIPCVWGFFFFALWAKAPNTLWWEFKTSQFGRHKTASRDLSAAPIRSTFIQADHKGVEHGEFPRAAGVCLQCSQHEVPRVMGLFYMKAVADRLKSQLGPETGLGQLPQSSVPHCRIWKIIYFTGCLCLLDVNNLWKWYTHNTFSKGLPDRWKWNWKIREWWIVFFFYSEVLLKLQWT